MDADSLINILEIIRRTIVDVVTCGLIIVVVPFAVAAGLMIWKTVKEGRRGL